jgi:hypothetical protein
MGGRGMTDQEVELLRKAKFLTKLRGYQEESLHRSEETIDVKVSKPYSDETVLIHIVAKSKLKSGSVGVEKVEEAEQILEESDIDRIILFGKRFTSAARRRLREDDIEYFSRRHRILSTLNQQELYSRVLDFVDELCQIKCEHVPQSEDECEGYSKESTVCSFCGGSGKLSKQPTSYREGTCPVCSGLGSKENHYSCKVRLISDNADFHLKHDWTKLLQNDLLSLLKILRAKKLEHEECPSVLLAHSSPITTMASI